MSSPFFGQEAAAKEAPVARPVKTFTYFDSTGEFQQHIEANYIKFETNHVTFWLDRPEHNVQDTLVLAEINTNVTELKELLS